MRIVSRALAAFLLAGTVSAGTVLAGCGGSSPNSSTAPADTQANPGPNSTVGDPGPNNTSNGPETLEGTLRAVSGCIQLEGNAANQPATVFQLEFAADTVTHSGTTIVLTGSDGKHTIGSRDTVYVAGHPASETGPCGHVFRVEKVVGVTPAS